MEACDSNFAEDGIQWSEDTKKYFRGVFDEIAEDGYINAAELEECLLQTGLDAECYQLDWLIQHFDKDRNERLDVQELIDNLPVLHAHSVKVMELQEAFKVFDKNGDGYIRLPELKQILAANGRMDGIEAGTILDCLVRNFDHDNDGKINYSEFLNIYWSSKGKHLKDIVAGSQPNTKQQ